MSALGYAFGHHPVSLLATQHFVLPNIIASIVGILGLVIFAIGMNAGCGLYSFPLSLAPHLIAACFAFPMITRRKNIAPITSMADVTRTDISRIFVLGFDLFWIALYNLILGHTLLLYGGMILATPQLAILSVNLKLVQFALQVAQRLPGTAEPILAQMVTAQDFARFRAAWLLSAKTALGVTLVGTGILYLWAGFAVHYWTSDADIMRHWALLLVCLLPFRYILHTVCVLGCTLFKAANRMRFPLVWELILYTALSFPLGHKLGVGGLLAASMISLVGGSLVPGIRLIQKMGHFSPAVIPIAVLKTVLPTLTLLLFLGATFPQPEGVSFASRCAITAGWTLLAGLLLWFIALDSTERLAIEAKLGAFRRKRPPAL
jgi:Na+-driven multidrug efflux pump